MAEKRNRPDHDGTHRLAFERNKKRIYATQTVCGICGKPVDFSLKYSDEFGLHFTSGVSSYRAAPGSMNNTGGNQPHNNMPPYLSVYVWQRTA